uniref:Uncharacterized protein n=1 Tax=Triticum urartu TaxID=4572 RepID=A0A8R7UWC6_TRIUA
MAAAYSMLPGHSPSAHAARSGRRCGGERSRPSLKFLACAFLTSSRPRTGRAETVAQHGACSSACVVVAGAGAEVLGVAAWCCGWGSTRPPTMALPSACGTTGAMRVR